MTLIMHLTAIDRPRLLVGLALALLLCACSVDPFDPGGDGIGGTGIYVENGGDGIGGTGIIGALEDDGKLRVNGLTITYDAGTRFSFNLQPVARSALQPGHVVEVLADGPIDALRARTVQAFHALAGPVQSIDGESLRIMGTVVRLDRNTRTPSGFVPKAGDWIAISGFADLNGEVHASRIEPSTAGQVIASGRIDAALGDSLGLAGRTYRRVNPDRVVSIGRRVWLQADAEDRIIALAVRGERPFDDQARRLVVQGFAQPLPGAGGIRLVDWAVRLPADSRSYLSSARPLTMDALSDGRGDIQVLDLDPVRPDSLDTPTRLVAPDIIRNLDADRPAAVIRPTPPDAIDRPDGSDRPVRPEPDVRLAPIRDAVPDAQPDPRELTR